MKLQHSAIMFVLIFMPILLVISYYISLQVNTIKLESSYDEKLLNATSDAMTSFELNTANEELSSVSDSLRSIIDASTNIFFNTLCTNLGVSNASKSFVQPYIPAILYTLYDGYYIYSPTNIPEICVDKYGRTIRTSDFGVTYYKEINGVGIYKFDKESIVYSKYTTTEPAPENPEGDENKQTDLKVDYGNLPNNLKEEYGQILYKNNNGTYSTVLHSWSDNSENSKYSTYYKRDYILKSYVPYSATYSHKKNGANDKDIDITINYTLDNFMTIEGMIGGVYYTKSGYFIEDDLVSKIEVREITSEDGTSHKILANLDLKNDENAWKYYSDSLFKEYIENPAKYEVIVYLKDDTEISNRYGKAQIRKGTSSGIEYEYWKDSADAVKYYVESYIFSKWVHENLSEIEEKNLLNTEYSVADIQKNISKKEDLDTISGKTTLYKDMLYNFNGSQEKPFFESATLKNNPESEESIFYKHKRNVIKNSITYNLILSMLVYTEESRAVEFNMPVLSEIEWDRILKNVSIVSFMEGMKCGLKYYNNYAIVTSTNNEISVTENEIYYVPREIQEVAKEYKIINRLDDDTTYETAHRIDCENLKISQDSASIWLGFHSFKSKEIKYDKILVSRKFILHLRP